MFRYASPFFSALIGRVEPLCGSKEQRPHLSSRWAAKRCEAAAAEKRFCGSETSKIRHIVCENMYRKRNGNEEAPELKNGGFLIRMVIKPPF